MLSLVQFLTKLKPAFQSGPHPSKILAYKAKSQDSIQWEKVYHKELVTSPIKFRSKLTFFEAKYNYLR